MSAGAGQRSWLVQDVSSDTGSSITQAAEQTHYLRTESTEEF